jgi:DNA-binding MarR family transcriptional regulator
VVDQHLGSLLDATFTEAGLTANLYAVYSQLADGPCTPGQLSDVLGVRPTTLSGYLATMVERGHMSRSRNEQDGRSSVLSLTEAGHAKVRECRPLMQRALKTLNAEIGSADDVHAARALIARIDRAIQVAHRRLSG